ncbi:MAG: hypothetical protein VYD99_05050, partial [Planctomycetota bacterium]|nr:hypothetical protein [Planctomycetota bacterium]
MPQIHPRPSRTRRLLTGLGALLLAVQYVAADAPELERKLNERLLTNTSVSGSKDRASESGLSITPLVEAYLAMTPPPMPVGDDFNLTTIWPGMPGWNAVAGWAASNERMAEAITEVQDRPLLGMRYGRSEVPAAWQQRDVVIDVAPGGDLTVIDFPYLDAMDTIVAFATAEFYRWLEAGVYESAFTFGLAYLR